MNFTKPTTNFLQMDRAKQAVLLVLYEASFTQEDGGLTEDEAITWIHERGYLKMSTNEFKDAHKKLVLRFRN